MSVLPGERTADGCRLALDHAQKCARGSLRTPPALLPILQGVELESEAGGKLRLRKTKPRADRLYIHVLRHMGDKSLCFAPRVGQRLARAPKNALARFRHGQTPLLYSSTMEASTSRSSFRSAFERFAFSPLPKIAIRNTGTS